MLFNSCQCWISTAHYPFCTWLFSQNTSAVVRCVEVVHFRNGPSWVPSARCSNIKNKFILAAFTGWLMVGSLDVPFMQMLHTALSRFAGCPLSFGRHHLPQDYALFFFFFFFKLDLHYLQKVLSSSSSTQAVCPHLLQT